MKNAIVTSVFSVVLIVAGFPVYSQVAPNPAVTTTTTGSATIKFTKTAGGTIGQSVGALPSNTICTATATSCEATASSLLAVKFTPTPTSGMFFAGWSDGTGPASICNGKKDPCGFTAAAGSTVILRATFAQIPLRDLRVEKVGQGKEKGVVTSVPPGITCGSDCFARFSEGTTVKLEFSADNASSFFKQWESSTGSAKSCPSTNVPCELVIMQNSSVQARFGEPDRVITVVINRSGTGQGTVRHGAGNPGFVCTTQPCSFRFDLDETSPTCVANTVKCALLNLSATASAGSAFVGWRNGTGPLRKCDGSRSECKDYIIGSESITAEFVKNP